MRTHYQTMLLAAIAAGAAQLQEHVATCAETATPAKIVVSTREELQNAVADARPGTTIAIAAGTYRGGLRFTDIQGTQQQPIVLIAQDANRPPVFQGGTSGFHLTDPKYVELNNLVFTGATQNGLNIDDGGSYDSPAHHVVLRKLQVRDVGPDGNRDGIKLSGVDEFLVEICTIERWGSGGSAIDMVGCHQGRISECQFRHRSDLAGSGVQVKGGSSKIAIQRCRFENAGGRAVNIGGSTGLEFFRPQPGRYEAKDITVEDCTFIGSMAPIAFAGADGAVVRYNTIYRPTRWVVRILQESRGEQFVPCRNGVITNNLIVFRSDEVRTTVNIGDDTAPKTFRFAKNYWFCSDRPQQSSRLSLPVEEVDGRYGVDPKFVDEAQLNLQLLPASSVRDAGVRATPAATKR